MKIQMLKYTYTTIKKYKIKNIKREIKYKKNYWKNNIKQRKIQ